MIVFFFTSANDDLLSEICFFNSNRAAFKENAGKVLSSILCISIIIYCRAVLEYEGKLLAVLIYIELEKHFSLVQGRAI
jgi:hypothetical protein